MTFADLIPKHHWWPFSKCIIPMFWTTRQRKTNWRKYTHKCLPCPEGEFLSHLAVSEYTNYCRPKRSAKKVIIRTVLCVKLHYQGIKWILHPFAYSYTWMFTLLLILTRFIFTNLLLILHNWWLQTPLWCTCKAVPSRAVPALIQDRGTVDIPLHPRASYHNEACQGWKTVSWQRVYFRATHCRVWSGTHWHMVNCESQARSEQNSRPMKSSQCKNSTNAMAPLP